MSWFVRNVREMRWWDRGPRGFVNDLVGDDDAQLGVNLFVLGPGEPMSMYHWETDQEDFLVLAGEPVLVCEGVQRRLSAWDFVHCPAGAGHVIVGAGETRCLVLAVGARDRSTGPDWGAYPVDGRAGRLGASVERETSDPAIAYARFGERRPSAYREGWLPDLSGAPAS